MDKIPEDVVEALKAGGIHLARSALQGEFMELVNYDDAMFSTKQILGKASSELLPGDKDARLLTNIRTDVAQTGKTVIEPVIGTPLFVKPGFSHARGVFVPHYKDASKSELVGCTSLLIDISDKCKELADTNNMLEQTVHRLEKANAELEKSM